MYRICLFLGFCTWMILLSACQPGRIENDYGLQIQLSDDSSKVSVSNLPDELIAGTDTNFAWKQFFAVYEVANDPDWADLQPPLAGTYLLTGNQLEFKPEVPFKKGHQYEAKVYVQSLNMELLGMLQKGRWQSKKQALSYKFSY
jgi:hypothetical protein